VLYVPASWRWVGSIGLALREVELGLGFRVGVGIPAMPTLVAARVERSISSYAPTGLGLGLGLGLGGLGLLLGLNTPKIAHLQEVGVRVGSWG
jgi:hypothetical protein